VNKRVKRPEKPVATITTGLDRIIKEYFNIYRPKGILPPVIEGKVPGKLIQNLPKKGWLEYTDSKLEAKLGGYLDECLDLGNRYFAALDHKTRGLRPESTHSAHQFQMDAYTLLLEENGFLTQRKAYLVYYIPKTFATLNKIEFELVVSEIKTDPDRARKVFSEAVELLKKTVPEPDKKCEFCKWVSTASIK